MGIGGVRGENREEEDGEGVRGDWERRFSASCYYLFLLVFGFALAFSL
jgi:hypothetical protein